MTSNWRKAGEHVKSAKGLRGGEAFTVGGWVPRAIITISYNNTKADAPPSELAASQLTLMVHQEHLDGTKPEVGVTYGNAWPRLTKMDLCRAIFSSPFPGSCERLIKGSYL